jgi:DNA (cytosine-5)-methyltransferase 1
VDIAINHDPEAVSLHQANHPQTRHFVSDVFEVDPIAVTNGQPVGLLWASPDCKHFSKAKGGKPVSKKIRSLAGVVIKWVKALGPERRPRVICLENVEEFQHWGPLVKRTVHWTDDAGRPQTKVAEFPCPERKGETFQRWKRSLELLGYVVEYRELRACDYGAPTIRKRLFLVARCDGAPIVWPEPTHGAPDSLGVKARKLKPWRTAAECIDWSIAVPSIFERSKPLADATCRRIAKGVMRYVVDCADPFIVPLTHQGGDRVEPVGEPFRTITGAHRGEKALAVPTIISMGHGERAGQQPRVPGIEVPHSTITAQGQHSALVTAFIAKHYTGVVGSDLADPLATVTSQDHNSLVAANLVHMGHGEGKAGGKRFSHGIRDVQQPLNTITASGMPAALVASHMITIDNQSSTGGHSAATEPLKTTTVENRHALVRAFLVKYYGVDQAPELLEPLHTVTTRDRFGLVTVKGEPYAIVDIGLRMLSPRELYRAQGFPDTYHIATGADGRPLTKTAQVRMCGNSVCPPMARAMVAANYSEATQERIAA